MVNRIRYFVGMEKQLEIAGHRVLIRYKRVKHINMRLQATPQGGLVSISAPRRVTMREIAAFLAEKTAWIEKKHGAIGGPCAESVKLPGGGFASAMG